MFLCHHFFYRSLFLLCPGGPPSPLTCGTLGSESSCADSWQEISQLQAAPETETGQMPTSVPDQLPGIRRPLPTQRWPLGPAQCTNNLLFHAAYPALCLEATQTSRCQKDPCKTDQHRMLWLWLFIQQTLFI